MKASPFIKWVGGKSWLVKAHPERLPVPAPGGVYYEPFMGGAARFWDLPVGTRAVLADVNQHLVTLYRVVRSRVEDLIVELSKHHYEEGHYYQCRHRLNNEVDPDQVERAAWVMVLNKFGFNGLWRVNKKGLHNVPFGAYVNPALCDADGLRWASEALQSATIHESDFVDVLNEVEAGDAVFLDPPYVPASASANFTGYAAGGFGPAAQRQLVASLHRLDSIGARWVLTNSDTPESRALYAGWDIFAAKASRSLNCKGDKRGKVGEILVTGKAGAR
jgi:DNA adenine methylase